MDGSRIEVWIEEAPKMSGDYVLYWMHSNRRAQYNHALDRAIDLCRELGKPLLILEALRCDYEWASQRVHCFILEGMRQNARDFELPGLRYYPFVERKKGQGKGLLASFARGACAVVTDASCSFFVPRMLERASEQLSCRFELVDSVGLLPVAMPGRAFKRAVDFRRFLQKFLVSVLADGPRARTRGIPALQSPRLPRDLTQRWPAAREILEGRLPPLGGIDIPTSPAPVAGEAGGSAAARQSLKRFLELGLDDYSNKDRDPCSGRTSRLSAYLHFGHLSVAELLRRIASRYDWSPERVRGLANGKRSGWWGLPEGVETFLDEIVTWRELCQNGARFLENFESYESLPDWAQDSLLRHARDPRPHVYDLQDFEEARTHDELWNATQRQLLREGRIHGYLRMLWGKKILHYSRGPREALEIMIELNNRYALDGRDPNSYGGMLWTLGRYDRAWGPERPIFGKVRYMSSANTKRKLKLSRYLERYGEIQGDSGA